MKFSTLENDFYRKLFQRHDDTQDKNKFQIFDVPIGNSKCVEKLKFHSNAPMLKYCQKSLNSLVSDFAIIEQTKAANYI